MRIVKLKPRETSEWFDENIIARDMEQVHTCIVHTKLLLASSGPNRLEEGKTLCTQANTVEK